MPFIPMGPYRPDTPEFMNSGSLEALNVAPTHGAAPDKLAYRPLPSMNVYSNAIASRPFGAIGVKSNVGAAYVFVATRTKLYQLVAGSLTFTDVSQAGNYDAGAEGAWSFARFGEFVIATNGTDPIQAISLGSSNFDDLSVAAPLAKYVAPIGNFLVAANTSDTTFGIRKQRIWWSAIEDPGTWPTPGGDSAIQLQSDYQDILGDGGEIMGLVGGLSGADGLVFMERQLARMTYLGGRVVFSVDVVEGARGTPSPRSIAVDGGQAFYLGQDDFYLTDGSTSVSIGSGKVARKFFKDVDDAYMDRVVAAIDPVARLVFVNYPAAGNVGGRPNRTLIYNLVLGEWAQCDGYEAELLFRTDTFGVTVDASEALYPGGPDAWDIPTDSRVAVAGESVLSAMTGDGKLAYFTGENLAATVDTTEANLAGAQRGALVNGCWPIVDGGTVTAALGVRDRVQDTVAWGSANAASSAGFAPGRARGRYHRVRLNIASGGVWTSVQGAEIEAVPTGRRA